jgi:hypothetical protein
VTPPAPPHARYSLANIFLPFKLEVWLLHLAMMALGAGAILYMENTGSRFWLPCDMTAV